MSDKPQLKSFVHVDEVWYGPDSAIPAAVVEKIGDHCWVDGKRPSGRVSAPKKTDQNSEPEDGPPPMSGKGSGDAQWRTYAKSLDLEVADDAKRADIVEALKTAGHPVERTSD